MYKKSILENGIRVVTARMKERDSISLGMWCGVGGRYETDEIKGAAHFLEHIVFKGTKKYSCHEIKERVEGVGGSLNAFTSEEETCYFAKIPYQYADKAFDVLADMVFYPNIARDDFERERGVILEEIKMYHDLPQYFVMDELMHLMWPGHALGKRLTGDEDSVSKMTFRDLARFHRGHYIPNNIVVAAAGNVSHEKMVELVRKKTARLKKGDKISSEPVTAGKKRPGLKFFNRTIEQMHVALGVLGLDCFDKDRFALNLLNIILGGNMSSRLFNEVREKRGLAYSIHSGLKFYTDTGLFMVRAGVDNFKVAQALEVILKELEKMRRNGVTDSEFKRAKEYLIGQLSLGLEDTMEHMLWIGESMSVRDRVQKTDEVVRSIKRVTRQDIQRLAAKLFIPDSYGLSVVGPLKNEQKKQIRQLFSGSR